jgi:hypothetical protein
MVCLALRYDALVLRILTAQVLPFILALFGALLGVAIGLFMGATERTWLLWTFVIVSGLVAIAGGVYLIFDGRRLNSRVKAIGSVVRDEIDRSSQLAYRARGQEVDFPAFVTELETWRTRVDVFLRRELPNSGADVRFRTGSGPVGQGERVYEYGRLKALEANLLSVLDNLPSYVQRWRVVVRCA